MPLDDLPDYPPTETVKRGRGRPKGAKNKPKAPPGGWPVQTPPPVTTGAPHHNDIARLDFKYADPETLAARNMSLIDHAQQALRHELGLGFQADGKSITDYDIAKIVNLCAALDRAATGMLRVQKVAAEIAKNLTPEETLEKAILKVMGQDVATQRKIIQRLEAGLKRLARKVKPAGPATATDAIAALDKVTE